MAISDDLARRLLIAAERNWQVAEDEGFEDRGDLALFLEARLALDLPARHPRFNSFMDGESNG